MGKKENNKCYETWLDDETIKILNDNNIKLVSDSSSYNIFLARKSIIDIENELVRRGLIITQLQKSTIEHLIISESLPNDKSKDYILFKCHFKWSEIINKEKKLDKHYGSKKRFVIKHGDLKLNDIKDRNQSGYFDSKEYYEKQLCIKGKCILDRDYITTTINNIKIYNKNIHIPSQEYYRYLTDLENKLIISSENKINILEEIYKSLVDQSLTNEYNLDYQKRQEFNRKLQKIIEDNKGNTNSLNKIIIFEEKFNELIKEYSKTHNQQVIQPVIQSVIQPEIQPVIQSGGYNNINKINKLIKKINLYKYNFKQIIRSNPSLYSNYSYIGFNLNNKKIYVNNRYSDIHNYINRQLIQMSPFIQHIIKGNILIFSNNINMLLLCDKYLKNENNNIFLILANIDDINSLKYLYILLNNKDKIKIYYFGNILNNELINNIIKYFNNTKFSNIIIDVVDNNQVFYNILGLKICKKLLLNFGSFVQLGKICDLKEDLIYLYNLIFKCFKYNTFENYTAFILEDKMYSLIYHTHFEYNLNNEEENIINHLLSNDKTNLNNIIFDKLFIDYLYIKYLTIYYNLKNSADKIFKTSYKLIEDKINTEQKGGDTINNETKLDLYDFKYLCIFLEKQLFLLHLNCLTKVYLYENKNLDNFYIYYDDHHEGYGYYQEILKNMFKQLTWTNKQIKSKECIYISNNLDMYHKIKPKYALMDFKPDTDNNFFDGEILYTLYPFSNTDFKILVKEYNKIKKYPVNIFQELIDNNKFFGLCYNYDIYNINKVISIKYLKLIPGYTDNFECILEYKILYNFFYRLHDVTDHKIIINKLFDITIDNKNNMKYWLTCTLNKFQNAINEIDIMLKNIIQLNIEHHAKNQIQLLNDYGSEVFDKQKISKAIKILEKYASDRVYIQIL